MGLLIAISGASALGKDSRWLPIAEALGCIRYVPFTTRRPRQGETEGFTYRYLSETQFQEMIRCGQLLDWDFVFGNYYGTGLDILELFEANSIVVMHILARMGVRLKYRLGNTLLVGLVGSDENLLIERLKAREYSEYELALRLAHSREESAHFVLFDYVVPDADIMTEDECRRITLDFIGMNSS